MTSKREAYLQDYHRRKTGVTFRRFGQFAVELGGIEFPSSYHCLAAQIPPGSGTTEILDLGCGDGHLLEILAAVASRSRRLVGVDMSEAELQGARARVGDLAELIAARAQSLPLPDQSMDWVLSHLALMLMDEIDAVICEIARVLRPGGRLAAVVPGGRTVIQGQISPLVFAALERAMVQDLVPWGDPRMHAPEGLAAVLANKFEDLVIEDLNVECRMGPAAYWEYLSDLYSVDCLPPESQAELRLAVLAAIDSMRHSDGLIPAVTSLRLVSATRRADALSPGPSPARSAGEGERSAQAGLSRPPAKHQKG
jgi:SAM-dependent methyltransferase